MRLESPLSLSFPTEPLVLRLWWRKAPGRPPTNAERVISVLTPALEDRLPTLMAEYARALRTELPAVSRRSRSRARAGGRAG